MAIDVEKIEDVNEKVKWDDCEPTVCHCPHCNVEVTTFLEYKPSWITYLLAISTWVLFGWLAICFIPIIFPAFKDVIHHCPNCLNVLHRQSRVQMPRFQSEIMTLKFGSCAMVLSMKYLIIFVLVVFVIVLFQFLRGYEGFEPMDIEPGPVSKLTWENYLEDCTIRGSGRSNNLASLSRIYQVFERKYRRRTFLWEGEVLSVREGFDFAFFRTNNMILVRGVPSLYLPMIPDMILMFSPELNDKVAPLLPPAFIRFNATLVGLGRRGTAHILKLWDLWELDTPDIQPGSVLSGTKITASLLKAAPVKELAGAPDSKKPFMAAHELDAKQDKKKQNDEEHALDEGKKAEHTQKHLNDLIQAVESQDLIAEAEEQQEDLLQFGDVDNVA